ncbi:MAG: NusG domain II-containing protein [Clostridia bacterium]|nr:NusG domain II-containing protein [Clostridia bacterium]
MLKKGDYIVFATVAAVILLSTLVWFLPKKSGRTVTVREHNKVVYSAPLAVNHTVKLEGNTVVIRNGKAYVKWANCRNQICVHHVPIDEAGDTILCLPHEVSVTVE